MNSLIKLIKTSAEKEYFLIKSLIDTLDNKFKIESAEITNTIKLLENEVPLYIANITELNDEVKLLRINLYLKTPNIEPPQFESTDSTSDVESTSDIKKIYRLISSKCHPDKTTDTTLHELFILATDAYNHNNYSVIFEIYNKLKGFNFSFLYNDITIEQKLELIKKEYEKRKDEYNKFSSTNGYLINSLTKTNKKTQARKLFLDLLFNQTLELENLKNQLEANLSKKLNE